MKLLLFSDLHGNGEAARRLVVRARDADVVVGAGDFGNARRGIKACVDLLRGIDRPTVLVPGNAESAEELADACRGWGPAHVLHGSGVEIGGVPFFGLGGGVPVTPFGDWSYDFTEEQAEALLKDCPARAVLVTHSPPRGAVDRNSGGRSLGSVAVREAIERTGPLLVACGHIHACAGMTERIGETPICNAGPDGVNHILDV